MPSAMEQRYSLLSQQVKSRETAQQQQEQEALRRRFAAMGALGSGASLKTEQKAREAGAQREAEALGQIEFAKLGEQAQQEEAQKQREFATSERLGGQSFAAEQAGLGRAFQTSERLGGQQFAQGERLGSQQFAAEQAGLGRQFQTSERLSSQEFAGLEAKRGYERQKKLLQMQQASQEKMQQEAIGSQERLAKEERLARSSDISRQLESQEQQAALARNLQQEMWQKEFDINKIVTAYNLGWRPTAEQTRALPKALGATNSGWYGAYTGGVGPSDYGQGMYDLNFGVGTGGTMGSI